MLRKQSFKALLEQHRFLERTVEGLKTQHPIACAAIRSFYMDFQAYEELACLDNRPQEFDQKFWIWIRPDNGYAHPFERKDFYNKTEASVFSRVTGIPWDEFQSIMDNSVTLVPERRSTEVSEKEPRP